MTKTSVTGTKSASNALNLNFSGLMNTSGDTGNTVDQAPVKVSVTAAETVPQKQEVPENIRRYKALFRDAYNFLAKHSPSEPDHDGKYWDWVIEDYTALGEKYANDELAKEMIPPMFAELEREYKRLNNGVGLV